MPVPGPKYVEVIGLPEVKAAISEFGTRIAFAAFEATKVEAEYEIPLTQAQVPVLTSNLQRSAHIEAEQSVSTVVAAIAYGGPAGIGRNPIGTNDIDVGYAMYVHENLEMHHNNGKAKFVEDVVREEFNSGRAISRMSETILTLMGGAMGKAIASGTYAGRAGAYVQGPGGRMIGSTPSIGTQEG